MLSPEIIALDLGKRAFGQSATPILTRNDKVPEVWHPYLLTDRSSRMRHLEEELNVLKEYMPLTRDGLLKVAADVVIAEVNGYGVMRTIVRKVPNGSNFYHTLSFPPKASVLTDEKWKLFAAHAPSNFVRLYSEFFDGLTDVYRFGGPYPLSDIALFENGPNEYEDFSADSEIYSKKYSQNVIKIFCSGDGGYFCPDLNKDQHDASNPEGILLLLGHEAEFSPHMPFWAYLDQWTAIALTDG